MRLMQAMQLMQEYDKCKACGNGMIGAGEGTVNIEDHMFRRTCKCGWSVEIRDEDK